MMPQIISQHRPSGVGEDRNTVPCSSSSTGSSTQHRPSGVGEDRNTGSPTAPTQTAGQQRPSGVGEDRNAYYVNEPGLRPLIVAGGLADHDGVILLIKSGLHCGETQRSGL